MDWEGLGPHGAFGAVEMVSKTGCFGDGRSQGKMSESRADCAATTSVIAPCPVTKGPKGTSS